VAVQLPSSPLVEVGYEREEALGRGMDVGGEGGDFVAEVCEGVGLIRRTLPIGLRGGLTHEGERGVAKPERTRVKGMTSGERIADHGVDLMIPGQVTDTEETPKYNGEFFGSLTCPEPPDAGYSGGK
jgi:hypothetical protein